jgi:hypothetical protein
VTFAAAYLREPDLFPARPAGEPWGTASLAVDAIAGPYLFLGLAEAQREVLAAHFSARVLAGEPPAAATPIVAFRVATEELVPIAEEPWELAMDLDPAPSAVRWATRRAFGRLDWRPELAAALWLPEPEGEAPEGRTAEEWIGTFGNALRIAMAHRLLERGGVLLHSAGVAEGEHAFVFFGRSGAGKSTLARLSHEAGYEVLSDELNALWEEDDVLVVERLPFAGDFGRDREAAGLPGDSGARRRFPLAALLALAQGRPPRREEMPRGRAVAELAACAPFVNVDPHRSPRLLETLERMTARFPVERLTFDLDPGFWSILTAPR